MAKPLFRPVHRLQWKLTFSYTWITMATLVILTFAGILAATETAANSSDLVLGALRAHAAELAPYVAANPPDQAGASRWLQQPDNLTSLVVLSNFPRASYTVTLDGFTAVVARQGTVVASSGPGAAAPGVVLERQLPTPAVAPLRAALAGQTDASALVTRLSNGTLILAYPLLGPYGRVDGALFAQTPGLGQATILLHALFAALIITTPVALPAALIGTFFGFLTARGFYRRFEHLSLTVDQWAKGDFAVLAGDPSPDELGQLARRLDRMAEQFQDLLRARQQLATLEERGRVARDLHDSVKQQVFAVSMLVNSARGLLRGGEADRAQACLDETDSFVQGVQSEPTALVQALRPAGLEQQGLVAALRELAAQWSSQSGIPARLNVQGEPAPSHPVEETLYRIVQEALANVARHSRATAAEITVATGPDTLQLRVDDDGQGFDHAAVQAGGVGLLSMQERMDSLGGTLRVESAPGRGTHITACFSVASPGAPQKALA